MFAILNENVIQNVKVDSVSMLRQEMEADIKKIILYGSCARDDYSSESDIDIAILIAGERKNAQQYTEILATVATELAMKYIAVVNFVCISQKEFDEKKNWYPYYKNIDKEGEVLYAG